MQQRLAEHDAWIDAYYYCPFHPDGVIVEFAVAHDDRKPGAGMLLRAIREHSIAPERSFMIGDKRSDMEAAHRAGIRGIRVAADVCDLAATVAAALAPLSCPSPSV